MSVAEEQIRADMLAHDDILSRHVGKEPYTPAILEASCRLVAYSRPEERIGKGKGLIVLDNLVAVGHDAEYTVVLITYICLEARNDLIPRRQDRLLNNFPVKSRKPEGFF